MGLRRSFWCSLRLALRLGLVDLWERALERWRGLAMAGELELELGEEEWDLDVDESR